MWLLKLLALVLGAAILVPSDAHLLEIAHKISMDRENHFAVKRIYVGWALSCIVIVVAIIVDTMPFLHVAVQELNDLAIAGLIKVFVFEADGTQMLWRV
jgi:hypothetical protein